MEAGVDLRECKKHRREEMLDEWQQTWNERVKDKETFWYLPDVRTVLEFRLEVDHDVTKGMVILRQSKSLVQSSGDTTESAVSGNKLWNKCRLIVGSKRTEKKRREQKAEKRRGIIPGTG